MYITTVIKHEAYCMQRQRYNLQRKQYTTSAINHHHHHRRRRRRLQNAQSTKDRCALHPSRSSAAICPGLLCSELYVLKNTVTRKRLTKRFLARCQVNLARFSRSACSEEKRELDFALSVTYWSGPFTACSQAQSYAHQAVQASVFV